VKATEFFVLFSENGPLHVR